MVNYSRLIQQNYDVLYTDVKNSEAYVQHH